MKRLCLFLLLGLTPWLAPSSAAAPLRVVTLHTVLTELTREVGGTQVTVTPLLRPGVDPHHFEPSPADVARLRSADLVIAAGLGLETYLSRLQSGLRPGLVLAVGARLPNPLKGIACTEDHGTGTGADPHRHDHDHTESEIDPHWWHSLEALLSVVDIVARRLTELRPANEAEFARNADAVRTRLVTLQSWARAQVATLPADRRVLVTSHDAFGYLAREFGFTVHPILGASTSDEASPRHLAAVIDLVRRQRVRTVFAEATSSPRLLEALARETKTRLGPPLWADGLGTEPENATIEAMFRHNLSAIVTGLRGE